MTALVELERIAAAVTPPVGATDVCIDVDVEPCGRLSSGVPSGVVTDPDGTVRVPRTTNGVAWLVDGLRRTQSFARFERPRDAYRLVDLLHAGPAPRSGPRSAPGALGRVGRTEGDPVPGVEPDGVLADPAAHRRIPKPDSSPTDSFTVGAGGAEDDLPETPSVRLAPAMGGISGPIDTPERPGAEPSGVPASTGADARAGGSSDGGSPETERAMAGVPASPGRACKACGRSLADLPPSPTGQLRETCNDACRQAYRRGHRAPLPSFLDDDEIRRVSRLAGPPPRRVRAAAPEECC